MKSITVLSFLFLILFSSCAVQQRKATSHKQGNITNDDESSYQKNRKIIYNSKLDLIVEEPDSVYKEIAKIAKRFSGYVKNSGNNYVSIRVKSENLSDAITQIALLGKIKQKELYSQDVTEQFRDNEISLDNAEKSRKRYIELLQKAQNVEEILAIEKELERLNKEIAILKSKINNLKTLTDFSTITVYYQKKVRPGILGYVFVGIFKAIKWLFVWD